MHSSHPERMGLRPVRALAGLGAVAAVTLGGALVIPSAAFAGDGGETITQASLAASYGLAVDSTGKMWGWGTNGTSGLLGNGSTVASAIPVAVAQGQIPDGVTIVQVATSSTHSLALGDNGKVYGWGSNVLAGVGDGSGVTQLTPVAVAQGEIPDGVNIVQIGADQNDSFALGDDGKVYGWGKNTGALGGTGTGNQPTPMPLTPGEIPDGVKIVDIADNGTTITTLDMIGDDGHVYTLASTNGGGELGNGTTTPSATPAQVVAGQIPDGLRLVTAASGGGFSLPLGDDGQVYGWGTDASGQLRDGTTATSRTSPVAMAAGTVPAGVKFVDIAAESTLSGLALGDDGKVYSWGVNSSGQLGDGTTTPHTSPAAVAQGQVPNGVRLTSVLGLATTSAAIGDDGHLYAWGSNNSGQTGVGATSAAGQKTPVRAIFPGDAPVVIEPTATTTTLVAGRPTVAPGGAVDLRATVLPVAAGTVEFFDGSVSLGSRPATGAVVVFTATSLTAGVHSFTAVFTPTDPTAFGASTATAAIVTVQDPTPTTVTVQQPASPVAEAPFALSAMVTPSDAVGIVSFRDTTNNVAIAGSAPVVDGVAQLAGAVENFAGSNQIVATFTPTDDGAFAPSTSEPLTVEFAHSPVPTIVSDLFDGVLPTTLGTLDNADFTLTLADGDTPLDQLTVTEQAEDSAFAAPTVAITGTGATRQVHVTPPDVETGGDVILDFTVSDPDGHTRTLTVNYGYTRSVSDFSPTGHYYYGGDPDLSAAVDAGDGYVLEANDENQTIELYKDGGGSPVKEFRLDTISDGVADFSSPLGQADLGGEVDVESAARVGDTIYWIGSMGNTAGSHTLPTSQISFTTSVTGSGADTNIVVTHAYGPANSLMQALVAWDQNNGSGLGPNALGFAHGITEGAGPHGPGGVTVEGFAFAPGSTSVGYLGFREPVVNVGGKEDALIVPINNFDALENGTATVPDIGQPIFLDLGGHTIRDIVKNADDQYVISAGTADASVTDNDWSLYTWNGDPNTPPVFDQTLPAVNPHVGGSWESISPLPTPLVIGSKIEIVTDSGKSAVYSDVNGDANSANGLGVPGLSKAYADTFTLQTGTQVTTTTVAVSGDQTDGQPVTLTATVAPAGDGTVQFLDGETPLDGPQHVSGGTATLTTSTLAPGAHAVTASFTPTDTTAFTASVSEPLTVTITPITRTPIITGTPRVGETVAADVGTWSHGTTFTYQWTRDGADIVDATSSTYTLVSADATHEVAVKVTGTVPGILDPITTTSSAVPVAPAAVVTPTAPTSQQVDAAPQGGMTTGGADAEGHIVATVPGAHSGNVLTFYVYSDPILVGTFTVASDGTVAMTLPTGLEAGTHRLVALDSDGDIVGWTTFTIAGSGSATSGLAFTGTDVLPAALGASALLLAGLAFLTVALVRRRRRNAAQ